MSLIYRSATDFVNEYLYKVLIPPHLLKLPTAIETGYLKTPFYVPEDPSALERSRLTIANMIELFSTNSHFVISEDKDVLSILHNLDCYIEEVLPLKNQIPNIDAYMKKATNFRNRTYELFRRILNRHPQWKESYSQRDGIFDILAKLYSFSNKDINLPDTLLEQLRVSPALQNYEQDRETISKEKLKAVKPGPMDYYVYS